VAVVVYDVSSKEMFGFCDLVSTERESMRDEPSIAMSPSLAA